MRWFVKTNHNLFRLSIGVVGCLPLLFIVEVPFAFKDEDSVAREKPAQVRGKLEDQRASGPTIPPLRNRDTGMSVSSALDLGASGDTQVRDSLLSAIGERGQSINLGETQGLDRLEEPLRALIQQTLSGSQQAMEQLVMRKDPRSYPPLVKALGHWDPAVRKAAARTLKRLRNKEVGHLLIIALEDVNPTLRQEAVLVLGTIRDQRAIGPLIQTLGDTDPDLREVAAWALGALGDERARDHLISVLGDGHSDVRLAATKALQRLHEPLGSLIHETLTGSQQAMEQLVMRKDPRSYPPLVKALGSWNREVGEAAAEALKKIEHREIVDLLIKALGESNPRVRRRAAWILNAIRDNRATVSLIKTLGDEDPKVRVAAAWALGGLKAPEARDSLLHSLGDRESGVRKAAAWGLGKLKDSRATESLIQLLTEDGDLDVRERAAQALGRIRDKRAVVPLIQTLGGGSLKLRQAVAVALGKIGDRRAVDPLIENLGSRNSEVRKVAAEALEKLGEPMGGLIHETLSGSPEAMQDLVSLKDPRALTPLIQALWDHDAVVRRAAARSLGGINDAHAVDALVGMASSWHPHDRLVATIALVKIDQESIVDNVIVAVKVLIRPPSIVYFLGALLLIFVMYKTARRVIAITGRQE